MQHRRLPIASPCSERFAAMAVRDQTRRYCDRCEQEVHDLSSMTRAEAEYFMLQRHRRGQPTCVRVEVRPDREIRFRPAPPRTAGPALVAFAGLMAACTGHLEASDLESPEDGLLCEDVSGYTIPCIDDGREPEPVEVIEDLEPLEELEPVQEPTEPVDPPQWADGDGPTTEGEPVEEGEGCPLKRWDDPSSGEVYELAGVMIDPEYSRVEERRIERDYRREQGRGQTRRQERRERRRLRREDSSSV